MKKLFAFVTMTATVLALFVAGQSPAAAHPSCASHGSDGACVVDDGTNQHYGITVCDNERDGHYAYVRVHLVNGTWHGERDGGDAGCDTEYWSSPIDLFYVCEEGKGCTGSWAA